jgi:hypothetical protein
LLISVSDNTAACDKQWALGKIHKICQGWK